MTSCPSSLKHPLLNLPSVLAAIFHLSSPSFSAEHFQKLPVVLMCSDPISLSHSIALLTSLQPVTQVATFSSWMLFLCLVRVWLCLFTLLSWLFIRGMPPNCEYLPRVCPGLSFLSAFSYLVTSLTSTVSLSPCRPFPNLHVDPRL